MVFSGSLPPGAVLRSPMKAAASPRLAEAQVLQAVERQVREGVVDHQVIDVRVLDAGFVEGLLARHAERARGGEVLHLADHRALDALAGAQDVDRLLREVLGALGAGEDERAAAVRDQAAHQDAERLGDHARLEHVVNRDRLLEGRARVLGRPLALHHGDHRDLLFGDADRSSCSAAPES